MSNAVDIQSELVQARGKSQLLHAEDVVGWARKHPRSLLHSQFEWHDGRAAEQWRLSQARRLIAVHVVSAQGMRKFVSLSIDRKAGGGYREIEQVIRHESLRSTMLADAMREFARVRNKYQHLQEFSEVYKALDKVHVVVVRETAAQKEVALG